MNLKVPGAILPLGCAILSTRAITVRGGWYNPPPPPPLGELGLTMVFGPKFQYFFFQLNEVRDEAKTWWLVSGPDVASSYFF